MLCGNLSKTDYIWKICSRGDTAIKFTFFLSVFEFMEMLSPSLSPELAVPCTGELYELFRIRMKITSVKVFSFSQPLFPFHRENRGCQKKKNGRACFNSRRAWNIAELEDFFLSKHWRTHEHTFHYVWNCFFTCSDVAFHCGSCSHRHIHVVVALMHGWQARAVLSSGFHISPQVESTNALEPAAASQTGRL